eukprot:SAG31_NODE_3231_length_4514_cov_4.860249_5_plen_171_part_00
MGLALPGLIRKVGPGSPMARQEHHGGAAPAVSLSPRSERAVHHAAAGRRLRHLLVACTKAPGPALEQISRRAAGAVTCAHDAALHWTSIANTHRAFAAGTLTPPELLEACLAQLDATESFLNAFVCDMRRAAREQARASASRWAAGNPLGPMDGALLRTPVWDSIFSKLS